MATPKRPPWELERWRRQWYGDRLARRLVCDVCGWADSDVHTMNDFSIRMVCRNCALDRTIKLDSVFRALDFVDQTGGMWQRFGERVRLRTLRMREAEKDRRLRRDYLKFRAETEEELRMYKIEWEEFWAMAATGSYSSVDDVIYAILPRPPIDDEEEGE